MCMVSSSSSSTAREQKRRKKAKKWQKTEANLKSRIWMWLKSKAKKTTQLESLSQVFGAFGWIVKCLHVVKRHENGIAAEQSTRQHTTAALILNARVYVYGNWHHFVVSFTAEYLSSNMHDMSERRDFQFLKPSQRRVWKFSLDEISIDILF